VVHDISLFQQFSVFHKLLFNSAVVFVQIQQNPSSKQLTPVEYGVGPS
jgi:hypothetical protein